MNEDMVINDVTVASAKQLEWLHQIIKAKEDFEEACHGTPLTELVSILTNGLYVITYHYLDLRISYISVMLDVENGDFVEAGMAEFIEGDQSYEGYYENRFSFKGRNKIWAADRESLLPIVEDLKGKTYKEVNDYLKANGYNKVV